VRVAPWHRPCNVGLLDADRTGGESVNQILSQDEVDALLAAAGPWDVDRGREVPRDILPSTIGDLIRRMGGQR
jgi:hypothetical protein